LQKLKTKDQEVVVLGGPKVNHPPKIPNPNKTVVVITNITLVINNNSPHKTHLVTPHKTEIEVEEEVDVETGEEVVKVEQTLETFLRLLPQTNNSLPKTTMVMLTLM